MSAAARARWSATGVSPDVCLVGVDGERFLAVSIGSGWRAHPLDTTLRDRFYALRSEAAFGPSSGYGVPDES